MLTYVKPLPEVATGSWTRHREKNSEYTEYTKQKKSALEGRQMALFAIVIPFSIHIQIRRCPRCCHSVGFAR